MKKSGPKKRFLSIEEWEAEILVRVDPGVHGKLKECNAPSLCSFFFPGGDRWASPFRSNLGITRWSGSLYRTAPH